MTLPPSIQMPQARTTRRSSGSRRALVPLAALATVAILVTANAAPASSETLSDSKPDTVSVQGTAVVTGTPDVLRVRFSVEEQGPTVDAALSGANAAMDAVREVVRDAGVAPADMQTSGVWIDARYGRGSTVVGYQVSEGLSVALRDLDSAGSVISDAMAAAGDAGRVSGIEFALEDNESLVEQARRQAVEDARRSAETLARAAGRSLGDAVTISEDRSEAPRPVPYAAEDASVRDLAAVPLEAGQSEVTVRVSIAWELT